MARTLIVILMALTLLPFLSMFTAALAPTGTYPQGLQWPADPQWANFAKAFEVAKMDQLLVSSLLIVLGVVPASVLFATMAGYGLAKFDKAAAGAGSTSSSSSASPCLSRR